MTLIEQIAQSELVKVRYQLKFLELFHFEPEMILHWRKDLLRAARRSSELKDVDHYLFNSLLNPQPADDPRAQKQFQKPAPPFIVDPLKLHKEEYAPGGLLTLEIVFPGDGVRNAGTFARLLISLGAIGLFKKAGRFEIETICALTQQDDWQSVWSAGDDLERVSMPIINVKWLIEKNVAVDQPLLLNFVSPARLLKKNRPLFKAKFIDIFPFILRRVTSVLYSCCQLELNLDVARLINDAQTVCSQKNLLVWKDWRHLDADHGVQGVGGISGSLTLDAGLTEDLRVLLYLAELFNIGKGASYGAGRFILEPLLSEMSEKR
jgi:hypothetical protein